MRCPSCGAVDPVIDEDGDCIMCGYNVESDIEDEDDSDEDDEC